jgi:hypothetical protein
MAYEYKSMQVSATLFDPDICGPLDQVLNEQAAEGWELVFITAHRDWNFIATFRRLS